MSSQLVLHPPVVHFPIAFWSLATVFDWVLPYQAIVTPRFSFVLVAVGLASALVALMTGFVEVSRIPERSPAMRTVYLHMGAMAVAFVLYLANLLLRVEDPNRAPSVVAIALGTGGFVSLVGGGWLGGQLVYAHGIGRSARTGARGADLAARKSRPR